LPLQRQTFRHNPGFAKDYIVLELPTVNLSLVILAAGIGSRYGGLKQMDTVGPSGEFILDYSVFDALRAGFNKVVFVVRRDIAEDFKTSIGARVNRHVHTHYVFQELSDIPAGYTVPSERNKPWGTGHAILCCKGEVREPFAVVNADDFYGRDSYRALSHFLARTAGDAAQYAMVGFLLRNTLSEHGSVARGVCSTGSDGCLEGVVERTKIEKDGDRIRCDEQNLTGDELVSMNMWGFKPSVFHHLEQAFRRFLDASAANPKAEFFIPTVVNELIEEKKAAVKVLETHSAWFGATYPEDRATVVERIKALVDRGRYPASLWD
jgi:UTP-glucose-1-phosphate uridylyltransferase